MNTLPLPSVTLMPEIVMGGGLCLCHNTTFRIASENTRMALPETKVGLSGSAGFLPDLKFAGAERQGLGNIFKLKTYTPTLFFALSTSKFR